MIIDFRDRMKTLVEAEIESAEREHAEQLYVVYVDHPTALVLSLRKSSNTSFQRTIQFDDLVLFNADPTAVLKLLAGFQTYLRDYYREDTKI